MFEMCDRALERSSFTGSRVDCGGLQFFALRKREREFSDVAGESLQFWIGHADMDDNKSVLNDERDQPVCHLLLHAGVDKGLGARAYMRVLVATRGDNCKLQTVDPDPEGPGETMMTRPDPDLGPLRSAQCYISA